MVALRATADRRQRPPGCTVPDAGPQSTAARCCGPAHRTSAPAQRRPVHRGSRAVEAHARWDVTVTHRPWPAPSPPGPVARRVAVPGSKSVTNRALLLAALSGGPATVTGAPPRATPR